MTKYGFLSMMMDKDRKQEKVFDALEWFAAMGSHVPNKGKQMVRPLYFNR